MFIGQGVGPDAISGLAVTFPIMNISVALGVLVGAGASARVSIMLGQNDSHGAARVLGNAMTLTLLIGLAYVSAFGVFLDPILRAFGASDATLPYAHEFMVWVLPCLLVNNLAFGFNNIMRASGYPIRAMVSMFIGAGLNVALDPIFIYGLGMGIKGAAIATDIAMSVTMVFVLAHFFRKGSTLHFTRHTFGLRADTVKSIISIGAAPSLVNLAACLINVIINTTLLRYGGDAAIGAAGIFTTYTSLLVMVVIGICQGMQPIVGYNYGSGHFDRAGRAFWLATGVSTVITMSGSIIGLTWPEIIVRGFTVDEGLRDATVKALRLALWAFTVVGFQIVATNFFQSIGQAGKSIFLSLTRQVIFLIPLLLLLPRDMGLEGVWLSFPISDLFATGVTGVLVWWQMRAKKRALKFDDGDCQE